MALEVMNNISALYAENNLTNTQNALQNTLEQLSSGTTLNSGADNPAGLSLADGLGANSAALTQSATNASDGVGLLQVADGALSQVNSLLTSAVTLATEASNGTLNSTQDAAAQQEYQSILSEVNNIGSTTTYNSQAVFGSSTPTQIYTGDSSTAGASIDDLTFSALSSASVGTTGGTIAQSATGTFVDLSTDTAGALTTAAAGSDSTTGSLTFSITGSNGDVSYISTTSGESVNQLVQEINTDGISGVSASLTTAGASGVSSGTAASGDVGILISNTNSSVTISQGAPAAPAAAVKANNVGTASQAPTEVYTLTSPSDTLSGAFSFSQTGATAITAVTGTFAAGTTGAAAASQLNAAFNGNGMTATWDGTAGTLTVSGTDTGGVNTMVAGAGVMDTNVTGTLADTVTGATTALDASTSGIETISESGVGAGADLAATNLNTAGNAQAALTALNAAISDVASQRGYLGSQINTLNSISGVETTEEENLTSAETSISATNYGSATTAMSSEEVLSQTGISALAQANSSQQEVLKLMQ
jgi:flagellin